ncbi:late competence protein comeA, DNA receptor [Lachnospiraceae bacterium KM106-2]|nr:late competence protein comeA, DNA receptor [Lachnospiraceae bacterium KM106-2]
MSNKKLAKIIFAIVFIGAAGLFYVFSQDTGKEEIILQQKNVETHKEVKAKSQEKKTVENTTVYVHICGMVKKPDVYELPKNARVVDGIRKAGGFKKNAASDSINQARVLKDGEQIYIPSKKEAAKKQQVTSKDTTTKQEDDSKININNATKEQLMKLPGIGEAKAEKIIAYREKNGGFQKVDQIMQIQGIKKGVYSKIKDLITV